MKEIKFKSQKKAEFIDITEEVREAVKSFGSKTGLCQVYCPHTTAGLTVNENYDPDVKTDILNQLEKMAPSSARYRHTEGNAEAHIKSSLLGVSVLLPVEKGNLLLGQWQGVLFGEFDGPRQRKVLVQLIVPK